MQDPYPHEEIALEAWLIYVANSIAGEPPWVNTADRNWYDAIAFIRNIKNRPPTE